MSKYYKVEEFNPDPSFLAWVLAILAFFFFAGSYAVPLLTLVVFLAFLGKVFFK